MALFSPTRTLVLLVLASASALPLTPLHRCRWTGMRGPGACCTAWHDSPACSACARRAPADSGAASETGFRALSGPCCLVTYVEAPRIGASEDGSRDILLGHDASTPPRRLHLRDDGDPGQGRAIRRARAGPDLAAGPPLFILHASLLL